jgi:hypothetical protein
MAVSHAQISGTIRVMQRFVSQTVISNRKTAHGTDRCSLTTGSYDNPATSARAFTGARSARGLISAKPTRRIQ